MSKKYLLTNKNTLLSSSGTATDTANYVTINNAEYILPGADCSLQSIYDMIYPVGYIAYGFAVPNVPTGVTAAWEKYNTYNGRALWVDNTKTIGTLLEGSLPGYEASFKSYYPIINATSGSISMYEVDGASKYGGYSTTECNTSTTTFNANNISSVFSGATNSTTVRPTAVIINCWRRVS